MTGRFSALAACIWLTLATPAIGQQCPERLGAWGYGPVESVALDDELAVMGAGVKLLVADLQASPEPELVGELLLPWVAVAIAVQDSTAYVAVPWSYDQGFLIVDIGDPAHPALMGGVEIPGYLDDIAVEGDVAYVASDKGLTLVDVSDPQAPVILSELTDDLYLHGVAVQGDYAYLADTDGLVVVDVSNPSHPFVTARKDTGTAIDVAATSKLVYLLSYEDLVIFGISNSGANPKRRGTFSDIPDPNAVSAVGRTVLVGEQEWAGHVHVIDASDPDAPTRIALIETGGDAIGVAAHENLALVGLLGRGGQLFDISDPSDPEPGAELPLPALPGSVSDVVVRDGIAFLADRGYTGPNVDRVGRLRIVDVSEDPTYREIANLEFSTYVNDVAVSGDHAIVTRGIEYETDLAVDVVDISDLEHPSVVGGLELPGDLSDQLVVSGNHAYLTDGRLTIIDLSDPTRPELVSSTYKPGASFRSVAVDGDRAFLAARHGGLCVYDLTDLGEPMELSCTPTAEDALWVAVEDHLAYVAASYSYPFQGIDDLLLIFDVAGDGPPVQIGSFPLQDVAGRLSVSGRFAFVQGQRRGLLVVDVADPTEPALLGVTPRADFGIGVGDRLYGITSDLYGIAYSPTLDVFDVSGCAAALPSADFRWQPADPILGEAMDFTDISAGLPTAWLWDFGDETTSSDQNPSHTFSLPGQHTVRLTVDNQAGSDAVDKRLWIESIAYPRDLRYIVPAVAHGSGKAGTQWRSDLLMDMGSVYQNTVVAYYMRRGRYNTLQPGKRLELPRGTTSIDDVVETLFGTETQAGAIFLTSDSGLRTWSRTYTLSGSGTFGQFIPAVQLYWNAVRGRVLIHLTQNQEFRTNLGLVNTKDHAIHVQIELYSADNTWLGSTSTTVAAFGATQINEFIADITSQPVDDGYAVVSTGPGKAAGRLDVETVDESKSASIPINPSFVAYASTIDNTTGDPVFMLPSVESQEPLWIPAVAHVEGLRGTVWRTDLEVCCDAGADGRFRIELLESGRDNSDPPSETFTLVAGMCARYRDVVESVFDRSATGAIRIVPELGMVRASSRIYTRRADGGTYGQYVAAVHDADVVSELWQDAVFVGLSQSRGGNRGFRTNLGLVNASPLANTVHLEISTHDKTVLERFTVELLPFEHRQLNRVLHGLAEGDLEDARIEVATSTHDARFIAYASVVDNVTGDAIYIP